MLVPVGGFLVRVGERLVLLDGIGDVRNEMFDGGQLLQSLGRWLGVQPADIDTIIVSHLHSDRMGWLQHDGTVTFPNATVHIDAADWQFSAADEEGDGKRRADRIRVVQEHVSLIWRTGRRSCPASPHEPRRARAGPPSTVLSSGTERLIVLGDALHCPAQLTEAEWQFFYDVDVELAVRTRQALVREAEVDGTTPAPCHFPGMQAARLLPAQGTRHWVLGPGT